MRYNDTALSVVQFLQAMAVIEHGERSYLAELTLTKKEEVPAGKHFHEEFEFAVAFVSPPNVFRRHSGVVKFWQSKNGFRWMTHSFGDKNIITGEDNDVGFYVSCWNPLRKDPRENEKMWQVNPKRLDGNLPMYVEVWLKNGERHRGQLNSIVDAVSHSAIIDTGYSIACANLKDTEIMWQLAVKT